MDTNKINIAVQTLLTACIDAPDPQQCLNVELDRLRATGNWLELELRQLRNMTIATINGMRKGT